MSASQQPHTLDPRANPAPLAPPPRTLARPDSEGHHSKSQPLSEPTLQVQNNNVERSIARLKVVSTLRSNNIEQIQAIAEGPHANTELRNDLLHIAVQVSDLDVIKFLLKNYPDIDINAQTEPVDDETVYNQTALHMAADQGRDDVVLYLLQQPGIDDTLIDSQGHQAMEVARYPEVAATIQTERNKYVEKIAHAMKVAFDKGDLQAIDVLLTNPRSSSLLDINGHNPETGSTVLHDFAYRRDARMVEFILSHGGNPLVRNKNGKLPADLTKDETIRKMLQKATANQQIISEADMVNGPPGGSNPAPQMKGFLKKWTNFTSGYKLRWFVLEDGVLSYYKKQDSTDTCRGSINMKNAYVRLDKSEDLKFEVGSRVQGGYKFHLKAKHPVETNKWVWNISNAIRWAKDQEKGKKRSPKAAPNTSIPPPPTGPPPAIPAVSADRPNSAYSAVQLSPNIVPGPPSVRSKAASSLGGPEGEVDPEDYASDDDEDDDDNEFATLNEVGAPNNADFAFMGRSIGLEFQMVRNAINILLQSNDKGDLNPRNLNLGLKALEDGVSQLERLHQDYIDTVKTREVFYQRRLAREIDIQHLWEQNVQNLEKEHEKIQRELHEANQEKKKARRSLREAFTTYQRNSICGPLSPDASSSVNNPLGSAGIAIGSPSPFPEAPEFSDDSDDEFFDADDTQELPEIHEPGFDFEEPQPQPQPPVVEERSVSPTSNFGVAVAQAKAYESLRDGTPAQPAKPSESIPDDSPLVQTPYTEPHHIQPRAVRDHSQKAHGHTQRDLSPEAVARSAAITAVQSHSHAMTKPPQYEVPIKPYTRRRSVSEKRHEPLTQPSHEEEVPAAVEPEPELETEAEDTAPAYRSELRDDVSLPFGVDEVQLTVPEHEKKWVEILNDNSFAGYEDPPRKNLSISADNRPRISLWGILKNLIGKDMTKMTLPVSFNECSSLLQRVAEDMEYTDLLDQARTFDDSTKRLAYVAAFAASEYASTTLRVAKPFNPLLGETFEYCRPDKKFRFFSEQVSHHPPIGACYAESPYWDYMGESNVKSKFTGRAFDINPLGTLFLNLRPDNSPPELYTWKKVNTQVVGIITGSPVVDNYGDMTITNHDTGDTCTLHFKARGWRGAGAFEVKGNVLDKDGNPQWTVGGHWHERFYLRKYGSEAKEVIWEVNPRPRAPFNLTPFAITLNALPDRLKPWLAPTDTRLRPDQRAMEEARYDDAATEKNRVEEKQRAARREREAKGELYRPRFFREAKHPVTGETYYEYNGEYWKERGTKNFTNMMDIF